MLHRTKILASAAAILLALSITGCQLIPLPTGIPGGAVGGTSSSESAFVSESAQVVELVRIVDGDTIAIAPTDALPATNDRGTEHHVRVLSIDAPEMNKMGDEPAECGAAEATDHLVSLLRDHQRVALVFDAISDHTDRFGRSLAYVETLGEQPVDIGLEQVRAGFAAAWYPRSEPEPERFASYKASQQDAVTAGAGAFGACATVGR